MTPYEAEKFNEALYNTINTSNLTFPTAFYVLKEVYETMQRQYYELSNTPPKEGEKEIDNIKENTIGVLDFSEGKAEEKLED